MIGLGHHHWLLLLIWLVLRYRLMIFGQFIVCHRSVLCSTGISFDDHRVTAHGPQALSPTTAEVKHEFDEDLPLKWLRIVITQHSGRIHFLHICSKYGRFMGRLIHPRAFKSFKSPMKTLFADMKARSWAMLICRECSGDCRWWLIAALMSERSQTPFADRWLSGSLKKKVSKCPQI